MMKGKRIFLLAVLSVMFAAAYAAKVDTVSVYSASMDKDVCVVVVVPDAATGKKAAACPTVYLLHGHGGNAKSWIEIKPDLPEIADEKGLFFVCPDGQNSWYWDSPQDPSSRYETFVSDELIAYIDANYNTIARNSARAITGLSMGGHGAMWNAIRHTDVFGACGSTSGGVDIRPFPQNWDMPRLLGEFAWNKQTWDDHTVINQISKLQNNELAIIFDCGENDFFLNVNKDLHTRLLALKINHDFITRPGGHDWNYWNNSIDYQILFFQKFFNR